MGSADLVTSSFVYRATTHGNGTVRKLWTVYQQISSTRAFTCAQNQAEATCLCHSQLTKPLVLPFLPVNMITCNFLSLRSVAIVQLRN